jgi:PIN domain nuclease of toxin-antitoxin system
LIEKEDAPIFVSAATAWEIATKARNGKLAVSSRVAQNLLEVLAEQGFLVLGVSIQHGLRAGWLPGTHRDPFDRMLAAQALEENMLLASKDPALDGFGVQRIW